MRVKERERVHASERETKEKRKRKKGRESWKWGDLKEKRRKEKERERERERGTEKRIRKQNGEHREIKRHILREGERKARRMVKHRVLSSLLKKGR